MKEFNLHTILRLPDGIFYADSIKTNVLFFEKGNPTENIWIYDYRTGIKHTLVQKPMLREDLDEFVSCYCSGHLEDRKETYSAENPNGRWRRFAISDVLKRDDFSLDFKWLNFEGVDERSIADILAEVENESKSIQHSSLQLLNSLKNGAVDNALPLREILTSYLSNIEALKKKVIEEGIKGNLTEREAEDGTAAELLKEIEAEKQELIKARKIKKEKPLPEITDEEKPFEIPKSWEWVRLEMITRSVGNKNNQILSSTILKEGKIPVVSQGSDFIDGYTNDTNKVISEKPVVMFGDHTRNVKYIDFDFVIGADGTKFFKPICVDCKYLYYLLKYTTDKIQSRGYARHYGLLKMYPLPPPLPLLSNAVLLRELMNYWH